MAESSNRRIVGCGGWTPEPPDASEIEAAVGHVRHFGTHPDRTGRGIGRATHDESERQARSAGIARLRCHASRNAVPFYAAPGFRAIRPIDVPIAADLVFPATAGGLALGGLVHAVAAALDLSALFAVSPIAFALLKYAGAAYLILLGVRMLLERPPAREGALRRAESVSPARHRIVIQAAVTEILNPKVAVFFIAFLPQFIEPGAGPAATQLLVFGLLYTLVGLPCDAAVAAGGHSLARTLARRAPVQRLLAWLGGTVLVALGVRLALSARQ